MSTSHVGLVLVLIASLIGCSGPAFAPIGQGEKLNFPPDDAGQDSAPAEDSAAPAEDSGTPTEDSGKDTGTMDSGTVEHDAGADVIDMPCTNQGELCANGVLCYVGSCQPCGGLGQWCCPVDVCNAGLFCSGSVCAQ